MDCLYAEMITNSRNLLSKSLGRAARMPILCEKIKYLVNPLSEQYKVDNKIQLIVIVSIVVTFVTMAVFFLLCPVCTSKGTKSTRLYKLWQNLHLDSLGSTLFQHVEWIIEHFSKENIPRKWAQRGER